MKLTVCQIIPTLVQGGAEKQLCLLAENLDPARFECHVVVLTHSGPLEERLRKAGVQVHLVGKRFKFDPTALGRLRKKLREIGPDIVHTWLFAANSYGRYVARQLNVPVVVAAERCVDPWKSWWHFMIDRHLAKSSQAIATNTSAVVDFYAGHGIDRELFQVIPNAVVTEPVEPYSKEEIFKELKIEPRTKIVGAIGRLWEQKGYKDLVWAAELLRAAYQDVWFVVLGDGPELHKLQQLRDYYGADTAVRFAGHRREASRWLPSFDVLWNGSLYEGQSNTILEAMSRGVPVIASDIPGNRDLVVHEETGYLYPLGDVQKLASLTHNLLSHPERLQEFSQASIQRVESEFSLAQMVEGYERLYERLSSK